MSNEAKREFPFQNASPTAVFAALLLAGVLGTGCVGTQPSGGAGPRAMTVTSPDGQIRATLMFDKAQGTLTYRVARGGREIITPSPLGIQTDRGDFGSGVTLAGTSRVKINETYRLPQGKVSTYHNRANELVLRLTKAGQEVRVRFRAYDDGVAFSYAIPGTGNIAISNETSGINLAGQNFTYWGLNHPNNFGYESMAGPINGERMSNPVLAHQQDLSNFVFLAQAATFGDYVNTHFDRSGSNFRFAFPMDQAAQGPVMTTLPFQSPWRLAIISPNNPGKIIESTMIENLNPPTDPRLLNPNGTVKDWVKPGRVMWDYLAGDKDKPHAWVDAVAAMGWEYYMADAGFARLFGGADAVREATAYAASNHVGILGWAHSSAFNTHAKAVNTFSNYTAMGLKGAKIDFFDHDTLGNRNRTDDYEDTQQCLQIRDWIFELAISNKFLLELHGCMIPTGERRRYPNLMTLEAVAGMEKRTPQPVNELTIPFVRNIMGPVSFTIIKFNRSLGTHAYQMALSVVYEAGLMIYAEHYRALLDWPGREMIKDVPSAWDETRFIEGLPASHIIIARRKGQDWFIAGITGAPRTASVPLDFLPAGRDYNALMFSDDTRTSMHREVRTVNRSTQLSFEMLQNGGFTVHLSPATRGGRL